MHQYARSENTFRGSAGPPNMGDFNAFRPPRQNFSVLAPADTLASALSQVDELRHRREKPPPAPLPFYQTMGFWLRLFGFITLIFFIATGTIFAEDAEDVDANASFDGGDKSLERPGDVHPDLEEVKTLDEEEEEEQPPEDPHAPSTIEKVEALKDQVLGFLSNKAEKEEEDDKKFHVVRLEYPPAPPEPAQPPRPLSPPAYHDPPKLHTRSLGDKRLDSLESYEIKPTARGTRGWTATADVLGNELHSKGLGIKTLYLGDGLFAQWRAGEIKRRVEETFNPRELAAVASAIEGDRTDNILDRIYMFPGFSDIKPLMTIIYAGQDDLEGGRSPQATAAGMLTLVKALHLYQPESKIVLLGLLPRADDVVLATPRPVGAKHKSRKKGPHKAHGAQEPVRFTASSFYKRITEVNEWYDLISHHLEYVHYLDCSNDFLMAGLDSAEEISPLLIPDMKHPSPQGHARLAMCMENMVKQMYQQQVQTHHTPSHKHQGKKHHGRRLMDLED